MEPSRNIDKLLAIMAALRTPETGCPWDLEQTFATIAPYTVEEAYEVAEAIARDDMVGLREELGDLLLQVVFQSRIAEEAGLFDFGAVVESISTKLIRRHPHVFGELVGGNTSVSDVNALWAKIKAEEKRNRGESASALDKASAGLPPILRAEKLQKAAAKHGFDWSEPAPILAKIREELGEVEVALASGDKGEIESEIGDLLFAVVNLARRADIGGDNALRAANAKFQRRFAYIESALTRRGRSLDEADLEEMDALWDEAKREGL